MTVSALINLSTNLVDNIIVADPAVDPTPDGYLMLTNLPDFVDIGTPWDGTNFVAPPPKPVTNPIPVSTQGLVLV